MQTKSPPPIKDNPELSSFLTDIYVKINSIPKTNIPASSSAEGSPGDWAIGPQYVYFWYGENQVARIQYTDLVF